MLLWEVVEDGEVVPVPFQALRGVGLAVGSQLGAVRDSQPSAGLAVRRLVHIVDGLAGLGVEPPREFVQNIQGAMVLMKSSS